jgi:nitroimidazol reductase NimA-like FMN-containing flavoprotein (pyridoxamine 5'-phosphate oxidase superfamily)
MGRVAFALDDEVVILPVNHVLLGEQIAFQTTWGSKLQVAADRGPMAFEVDGHDASRSWGWSVLAQGRATIIRDANGREHLDAKAPVTWAPRAENMFWVVITPGSITGREIHPALPPTGGTRDLRP